MKLAPIAEFLRATLFPATILTLILVALLSLYITSARAQEQEYITSIRVVHEESYDFNSRIQFFQLKFGNATEITVTGDKSLEVMQWLKEAARTNRRVSLTLK